MSNKSWISQNWKFMAFAIYAFICVFDFVIVPSWIGLHRIDPMTFKNGITDLDVQVQIAMVNNVFRAWEPLTLMGGGLFHLSFGAILGVAALPRGASSSSSNSSTSASPASRSTQKVDNPDE